MLFSFSLSCLPSPWLVLPVFSSAPFVYLVITSVCPVSQSVIHPRGPNFNCTVRLSCLSMTFGQFVDSPSACSPSGLFVLLSVLLRIVTAGYDFWFFKAGLCFCTSLRITLGLEIHCGRKDWAPTGAWITQDSKLIANNIELMLDKRA